MTTSSYGRQTGDIAIPLADRDPDEFRRTEEVGVPAEDIEDHEPEQFTDPANDEQLAGIVDDVGYGGELPVDWRNRHNPNLPDKCPINNPPKNPRRGPEYDRISIEEDFVRLAAGATDKPARVIASQYSISQKSLSAYLAAYVEEYWDSMKPNPGRFLGQQERRELGLGYNFKESNIKYLVNCFEDFRRANFITPEGSEYRVPKFHKRWIAEILRAFITGGRLQILSPPRHGKAIANDTPMHTSEGWKDAEYVHVGDELVGSDGYYTEVTGVYPQGETRAYEVQFSDGASLVTCPDHIWSVRQRYGGPWRNKTTEQLISDLHESDGRNKWRIPMMDPVKEKPNQLDIDPYVLGVWLGDGSSYKAEITTADTEVITNVENAGHEVTFRSNATTGNAATYGVSNLITELKSYSLSPKKFIPVEYLHASEDDRLALLQGLCDTDGSVAKNGSQQSFSTTNPTLARDFKTLVCSLGGSWTERKKEPGPHSKEAWEIYLRLPQPLEAFTLERKQSRLTKPNANNQPHRFIKNITPVPSQQTTCFTVDAPDKLFAAGSNYVLTHNTDLLGHFFIWMIIRNPNIRIMWIAGSQYYAERSVRQVQEELAQNDSLTRFLKAGETFKPQRKGSETEWTNHSFVVATRTRTGIKSPTMRAIGRGGRILSGDADLICTDDIEDADSTVSPTTRQNTKNWAALSVGTRKEAKTAWINIGSRQHADDIHNMFLQSSAWTSIVESAHNIECSLPVHDTVPSHHPPECQECRRHDYHGCVLFPQLRNMWYLQDQRANMGSDAIYEMNFLNMPRPMAATIFKKEPIHACLNERRSLMKLDDIPIESEDGRRYTHLIAGLDPSDSGYQAAICWAIHSGTGKRFLVAGENQKGGGIPQARDTIQSWHEKLGVTHWVIEQNLYRGAIIEDELLNQYTAENGITLEGHQTYTNKWDKYMGVTAMADLFSQGSIDLPYGSQETQTLIDEYIKQLLMFEDLRDQPKKTARYISDLVMASWFPEAAIRRVMRSRNRGVTYHYHTTPYAPIGASYVPMG